MQSVNRGTENWLLEDEDATVTLMLGGTQAATSSVTFRSEVEASGAGSGSAAAKLAEVKIDIARMRPNMVDDGLYVILMNRHFSQYCIIVVSERIGVASGANNQLHELTA